MIKSGTIYFGDDSKRAQPQRRKSPSPEVESFRTQGDRRLRRTGYRPEAKPEAEESSRKEGRQGQVEVLSRDLIAKILIAIAGIAGIVWILINGARFF